MQLNTELADAFLRGENLTKYRDRWFFSAVGEGADRGKNLFTPPDPAHRALVGRFYEEIRACISAFTPYNEPLWAVLFPNRERVFDQAEIHLIVGFPRPNDATVLPDPSGKPIILFDLDCWTVYDGHPIPPIVRNLLTHELCHLCVGDALPEIDRDAVEGDYLTRFDALVFNEGIAHLLAYCEDIGEIDWNTGCLAQVWADSRGRLSKALSETDSAERELTLYDAVYGNYYDKFGCMAGMLYFGRIYAEAGVAGLAGEFARGYRGMAERVLALRD